MDNYIKLSEAQELVAYTERNLYRLCSDNIVLHKRTKQGIKIHRKSLLDYSRNVAQKQTKLQLLVTWFMQDFSRLDWSSTAIRAEFSKQDIKIHPNLITKARRFTPDYIPPSIKRKRIKQWLAEHPKIKYQSYAVITRKLELEGISTNYKTVKRLIIEQLNECSNNKIKVD